MQGSPEQLSLPLFEPYPDEGRRQRARRSQPVVPSRSQSPRASDASSAEANLTSTAPALLTTSEAAEVLHVHPRTVQRLVERGELSAVHLGGAVRFDPFDLGGLIARLKRRKNGPEAEIADSVRARSGARVSFADRLRSQQHEHRATQA